MQIKIKRIRTGAVIPQTATAGSAGVDLCACIENAVTVNPNCAEKIPAGLSIAVPSGYAAFIFARSGLAANHGLAPANCVGVIDSDYRGEIIVSLRNASDEAYAVQPGERIAQMAVMPVATVQFIEEELGETERGIGGFGSTGKR